jgi:cytochrome c-type biogenesis protein CcmH
MSSDARDALEHRLRCQCGCTLDVFTCRTTDFSCQVSPAMHRDVMALVDGGYTEPEILSAFVDVYGERVLMAPPKVGFNVIGYILPATAIAFGAVALAFVLRRWKKTLPTPATARAAPTFGLEASPDELARLEAAIRDDV